MMGCAKLGCRSSSQVAPVKDDFWLDEGHYKGFGHILSGPVSRHEAPIGLHALQGRPAFRSHSAGMRKG